MFPLALSIAVDPVTTMRIEDVLKELRRHMTIILVTNLTQQARRLANRTMFLWKGEIVEIDATDYYGFAIDDEAAFAAFSLGLLNLDETLTKE